MERDIRRNFEFIYYAKGRQLCPDKAILDAPYDILRLWGGSEQVLYHLEGVDKVSERFARSCNYEVRHFRFPFFEAICTREEYPEMPGNPANITRIKLANYSHTDGLVRTISNALSQLPKDNLEPFVAH